MTTYMEAIRMEFWRSMPHAALVRALLCFAFVVVASPVRAQVTERTSLGASGAQLTNGVSLEGGAISSAGRYTAFLTTDALDLASDSNTIADLYRFDRVLGTVKHISARWNGSAYVQSSLEVIHARISPDGNWILLGAQAGSFGSGLGPAGTVDNSDSALGQGHDILLCNVAVDPIQFTVINLRSGSTTQTGGSLPVPGLGAAAGEAVMSDPAADPSNSPRYFAFRSHAVNLTAPPPPNPPTDGYYRIFLRDRLSTPAPTTYLVSQLWTPGATAPVYPVGGDSSGPVISADGRYVAFYTHLQLIPQDTNNFQDVYVYDHQIALTGANPLTVVSVPPPGAGATNGDSTDPSISGNGSLVAFRTTATNMWFPGIDSNGVTDIFVRDWQAAAPTNTLVSISTTGAPSNSEAHIPYISWSGRYVAFQSVASNLVAADSNPGFDVFRYDLQVPAMELLTVTSNGTQPDSSLFTVWLAPGCISTDGRTVCYTTGVPSLVPNDTNAQEDVLIRRDQDPVQGTPYCFGDGSGTACPCNNPGATGNGCANSIFPSGGNVTMSGFPVLTYDTVTLIGSFVPDTSCLFYQATQQANGGAGFAFGDGLRCGSGTLVRLATKTASSNTVSLGEINIGDQPISVLGGLTQPMQPGTRHYQLWYRNAAAFCTGATYNLTNGLTIVWQL